MHPAAEGQHPRPERTARSSLAGRRLVVAGVWLLGAVVLLVGADLALRLIAQDRIAHHVEESLPPGVEGDVQARIHGFSTLVQLALGRAEHVTIEAADLRALGYDFGASVDAFGVHPFEGMRTERLTGQLRVPEATLAGLAQLPGSDSTLSVEPGEVHYSSEVSVFGLTGRVEIEAAVELREGSVVIDPTSLVVSGSGFDQLLSQALPDIGEFAVPICTAEFLPAGLHVSELRADDGVLIVEVTASEFALTAELPRTGEFSTCRE